MATSEPTVEETLAWEAEQRPRAGVAAIVAGVATLAGNIIGSVLAGDQPRVLLVDGLRDAAGQQLPSGQGLRAEKVLYYDDHVPALIGQGVSGALGFAMVAVVLGYLFRATQARRPEMPRVAIYLALIGPILYAVATLALQIGVTVEAHDFATGGDLSTQAAHDALSGGLLNAMQFLSFFAILTTAIAFVLVALNAMRVGLLTRFMGILGVITGALLVFPIGGSPIIVQAFWLIALGFLIFGRWPNGVPPAWATGRAQPWPTQQELREAREAARRGEEPASRPTEPDELAEPERPVHPSSKKRKRKRR